MCDRPISSTNVRDVSRMPNEMTVCQSIVDRVKLLIVPSENALHENCATLTRGGEAKNRQMR